VHSVRHPPHSGPADGVTNLVSDLVHGKPLTAEREHFRHEWQILQFTALVESGEDLFSAPNLDQVANLKV
jgi:hypothetical protein